MIFGIGTDLVHIPRMEALLQKHGDKIAERILSESEFVTFQQTSNKASFLAKRFAAKEAAAKAMGTGFRDGLSLRHIAVTNDKNGKPELQFFERAISLTDKLKIGRSMISLSDENEYAIAFVTLLER
jgi:holo-[acyl-carrier protein] synthase